MEDSSFLESMEKIQREMSTIQDYFSYIILDRDHLYELVHMLHVEYLKDDEEIHKINDELMATQQYLRRTQNSLFESNIEIEKLHREL